MEELERVLDESRPWMVAQCGNCGADHLYRLISELDNPDEDWEQLQECGE